MASPSDWIILGALFVLAAICASCFAPGAGRPDRHNRAERQGDVTGGHMPGND